MQVKSNIHLHNSKHYQISHAAHILEQKNNM